MCKLWSLLLTIVGLAACGGNTNTAAQAAAVSEQKAYVEVLYFHGKQRCVTCNAMEKLAKEVVEQEFAPQVEAGEVVFKVIDISTPEGEKIADKYEVTWSALYINAWRDGAEIKHNLTQLGFSSAKGSPDVFKARVKQKIEELLK